jgi:monovalent cation/hydrogen antiporter
MQVTVLVLMSLLAVVVGGVLARATRWPLPLVQMGLGAALFYAQLSTVVLDPQVFFLLFLPPLLFLDGWRIPNDALRKDARHIVRLAFGLVVFTVLGMGLFIHLLIPAMPLAVAFALAAVLSPTDPTAVSAIAARTPIAPRLLHVLQGEALFNDASGLLCLRVAVAATLTGSFSPGRALVGFVGMVVIGLVVGVGSTWLVARLMAALSRRWGEDGGGQILLSLLMPFGVYLLAESLHGSGILAAAAAGVTMSAGDVWRWNAATRLRRTAVWDMVQTAASGSIFVLLGSQIPALWAAAPQTVLATGHQQPIWLLLYMVLITAVLAALRFAWVWVAMRWADRTSRADGRPAPVFGPRAVFATTLAGVRGAVTLAAVLTLPLSLADGRAFPARDLAIVLASGVIVLSLLLATLVLPTVLRGLKSQPQPGQPAAVEGLQRAAAHEAMAAIEAMAPDADRDGDGGDSSAGDALRALQVGTASAVLEEYRQRIERFDGSETPAQRSRDDRYDRQVRLVGLRAERAALRRLAAEQGVDDLVLRRLVRELDHQEARHLA